MQFYAIKGSKEKRNRNISSTGLVLYDFLLIWQSDPGAFDSLLLRLSQVQLYAFSRIV